MNHFEDMYRNDPDPWKFRTSWYEQRKYAVTVASLPREHYGSVWEPGCSIGVLTRLLAGRADRVDASDVSATAVRAAREEAPANVTVERVTLPARPEGAYDLVVLSELLYYLDARDREQVLADSEAVTGPGADLVVVHWRHHPGDAHAPGAEVNEQVRRRPGWTSVVRHEEADFVLDVLTRQ